MDSMTVCHLQNVGKRKNKWCVFVRYSKSRYVLHFRCWSTISLPNIQWSLYLPAAYIHQSGRVVKALDLRSNGRMSAWVRTPHLVEFLEISLVFYLLHKYFTGWARKVFHPPIVEQMVVLLFKWNVFWSTLYAVFMYSDTWQLKFSSLLLYIINGVCTSLSFTHFQKKWIRPKA